MSETIKTIARTVAAEHSVPISTAEAVIKEALLVIKAAVEAGETVNLHEFGTFKPKLRAARSARNPKTGEPIEVAEKQDVKFKAAPEFSRYLNP